MIQNPIPIGVDTETCRGKPITFQFFSEILGLSNIIWIDQKKLDATQQLLSFLNSLPLKRHHHYVLFGHNLSFDMVSLFYDRYSILRDDHPSIDYLGWHIDIIYSSVVFASLSKKNIVIRILDTFAYFAGSLARLSSIVCPHLPKLERPEGLGEKVFTAKDKNFCAYAMRDAEVAYYAGVKILDFHKEMNVSIAVSAPHFASKVFRRKYMIKSIPLPPRKIVYSALSSYHGGKNNLTVNAGLYKNVYSLDIRSAYPFAMSQFPSFYHADLYRGIEGKGTPKQLPRIGIYKISGEAKACKWPALYDHSFKPLVGNFDGIWVTGFELNEALKHKEVTLTYTRGYYYDEELDKDVSPFNTYAVEFFNRKDTAKDLLYREFWKLLLNSLYGKFIQTRRNDTMVDLVYDLDNKTLLEDIRLLAGGLFNPFIGSLITGHTRAYIHSLEHKYKALHTSTDGVFTLIKPLEQSGLGGLSIECFGDLLLFRNKLYIFYQPISKEDDASIIRSSIFPDKKIVKYALHGFHGDLKTLESLYKTGVREYEYIKVNKLRESMRRNLSVNAFEPRKAKLNY